MMVVTTLALVAHHDLFTLHCTGQVDLNHPGAHHTAVFLKELSQIVAKDLARPGETLKTAFEIVNMYRLQSGIDNYSQVFRNCVGTKLRTKDDRRIDGEQTTI